MDFDPRNPLHRPTTPPKTSWFEFLLDGDLLEEHLNKEDCEPSAGDLITIFLHQADVAVGVAKELDNNQGNQANGIVRENNDVTIPLHQTNGETSPGVVPKKSLALRVLALKVAAFLKWDLNLLHDTVPLPMVYRVLQELIEVTDARQSAKVLTDSPASLAALAPQQIFALQLFHRWCVQTVITDSFPSRPLKTLNVQVPGIMDANAAAGAKAPILAIAHEGVHDSTGFLEFLFRSNGVAVSMPSLHCFGSLEENVEEMTHNWSKALTISAAELQCQICYDLGSMYFLSENYAKARDMLTQASSLQSKMAKSEYCSVDKSRLQGYLVACGCDASMPPSGVSLHSKVEAAKKCRDWATVVALLMQDNVDKELGLAYRSSLEDHVAGLPATSQLEAIVYQVQACNVICRLQNEQTVPANFLQKITRHSEKEIKFLVQVIGEALKKTTSLPVRTAIISFVRLLCHTYPQHRMLQYGMKHHLNPEAQKLLEGVQTRIKVQPLPSVLTQGPINPDSLKTQEDSEALLRETFNSTSIKKIVRQLFKNNPRNYIVNLVEQATLPRELIVCLQKTMRGVDAAACQIFLTKAALACELRQYNVARELLQAAEMTVKDMSYSMSRFIRLEMLHVDLVQYVQSDTLPGMPMQELAKRASMCLSALQMEPDVHPRPEIIAACLGFLMTAQNWDFVAAIAINNNGFIDMSKLICNLCRELHQGKPARKQARDLWDAVLHIFMTTPNQQQKRNNVGKTTSFMNRGGMGMLTNVEFKQFITQIKDPVAVTLLVSCLTKLYNILKDDITSEISSDHLTLWPTALAGSTSSNLGAVTEIVHEFMRHALRLNPASPSWTRTQADIHFANNQYSHALKFYLAAGIIASEFFTDVVPRHVFDDNVYKRMIRCCTNLHCHTQVAVLCQFLEEVDYQIAFKSLAERACHDAMDIYYECIWDTTMLEYLINLHSKRGEVEKKQMVMRLIGQPELNCSNPLEILQEAAKSRKTNFLRAMAKQYL